MAEDDVQVLRPEAGMREQVERSSAQLARLERKMDAVIEKMAERVREVARPPKALALRGHWSELESEA